MSQKFAAAANRPAPNAFRQRRGRSGNPARSRRRSVSPAAAAAIRQADSDRGRAEIGPPQKKPEEVKKKSDSRKERKAIEKRLKELEKMEEELEKELGKVREEMKKLEEEEEKWKEGWKKRTEEKKPEDGKGKENAGARAAMDVSWLCSVLHHDSSADRFQGVEK